MVYYAVAPTTQLDTAAGRTRYANEGHYRDVYYMVMDITNDHMTAAEAEIWCECVGTIGDFYEHDLFTIEIIEENE